MHIKGKKLHIVVCVCICVRRPYTLRQMQRLPSFIHVPTETVQVRRWLLETQTHSCINEIELIKCAMHERQRWNWVPNAKCKRINNTWKAIVYYYILLLLLVDVEWTNELLLLRRRKIFCLIRFDWTAPQHALNEEMARWMCSLYFSLFHLLLFIILFWMEMSPRWHETNELCVCRTYFDIVLCMRPRVLSGLVDKRVFSIDIPIRTFCHRFRKQHDDIDDHRQTFSMRAERERQWDRE